MMTSRMVESHSLTNSSSSSSSSNNKSNKTMSQDAFLELEPSPDAAEATTTSSITTNRMLLKNTSNNNNSTEALLPHQQQQQQHQPPHGDEPKKRGDAQHEFVWLLLCFCGIMISFVSHNLLMERASTRHDMNLHEMSFLLTSSAISMAVATLGTSLRGERTVRLPLSSFAVLGLCNMGSSFFSVRSLRYVIFPVKVIAKSCKPVPVMLFGTCMGKRYPVRKYINVFFIVFGVALVLGGGDFQKKSHKEIAANAQVLGVVMLVISLCFDGGLGAFEDKLVAAHNIQPLDLMYNIHLANITFASLALLVMKELHLFLQMIQQMGWTLLLIGLCGAMGQVFIFITISKFGAVTSSIMGLARKVTTICASIYIYGHQLHWVQALGICISLVSMSGHPVFCCLLNNFGETDHFYKTGLIGLVATQFQRACTVAQQGLQKSRDSLSARLSLVVFLLMVCLLIQAPHPTDFVRQLALPLFPTATATKATGITAATTTNAVVPNANALTAKFYPPDATSTNHKPQRLTESQALLAKFHPPPADKKLLQPSNIRSSSSLNQQQQQQPKQSTNGPASQQKQQQQHDPESSTSLRGAEKSKNDGRQGESTKRP